MSSAKATAIVLVVFIVCLTASRMHTRHIQHEQYKLNQICPIVVEESEGNPAAL